MQSGNGVWKKVGIIAAILPIVAAAAGAYSAGRAVISMPERLARHDSLTTYFGERQTRIMQEMLCIQIADHRHDDWTKCLTE